MKRLQTTEKVIGENTFYITPFPAFKAARVSGELTSLLTPVLSSIAPALSENLTGDADETPDIMSTDIKDLLPAIADAAAGLTGDKIERIMSSLLIDSGNIAVEGEITDGAARKLTRDLADEVFCLDLQDMFILCFEVIKLNFGGFFEKIGARYGTQLHAMKVERRASENTESST